MLKHQQYTAWISIDDQPLETYAVETSPETNEVTCWIASEAGKKFSVHCRDSSATRAHTISVFVKVDGFECGGTVLRNTTDPDDSDTSDLDSDSDSETSQSTTDSNPNTTTKRGTVVMADLQEADRTAKPFMFSDINTTDEDAFMDVSSDGLGQIEIIVWKVVLGNDSRPMKFGFETDRKLHERAKKGLKHCVGLGDEIEVQSRPFIKTRSIGHPLAIFTFKYRQLELLKANRIIPVPATLKRKASQEIIDLTGDDVKDVKVESNGSHALARGECDACQCMLKKKRNGNKKLKQEQEPGRLVEVIDLT